MQCPRAILSSDACPFIQYISTLPHNRYDFRKKMESYWKYKCVFWSSPQLLSEIFPIPRKTERDTIINVYWSLLRHGLRQSNNDSVSQSQCPHQWQWSRYNNIWPLSVSSNLPLPSHLWSRLVQADYFIWQFASRLHSDRPDRRYAAQRSPLFRSATSRSPRVLLRCIAVNPLNAELNPIRHLLALVGARHIVHVSGITVNVMAVIPLRVM